MLPVMKRHEIQVLRRAGHEVREVAALVGTSERTVRRVQSETLVEGFGEAADRAMRERQKVGRPSKVEGFRKWTEELLSREPTLPTLEVLRRAREDGFEGGKSAFYAMVAELRPPAPPRPLVRFEGLAGEFTQHDFGEFWVTFVDGRRAKVRFFASRLKYSRTVAVTITPDQKVESLTRALVQHLHGF